MSNALLQPPKQGGNDSKRQIIFMVVLFLGLFIWTNYAAISDTNKKTETQSTQQVAITPPAIPATPVTLPELAEEVAIRTFHPSAKKVENHVLKNEYVKWTIDPNLGSIVNAELIKFPYSNTDSTPVSLYQAGGALEAIIPAEYQLIDITAKEENGSYKISRVYQHPKKAFTLIQTFTPRYPYALTCNYEVINTSGHNAPLPPLKISTGKLPSQKALTNEKSFSEYFNIIAEAADLSQNTWSFDIKQEKLIPISDKAQKYIAVQNKYLISMLFAGGTPFNAVIPERLSVEGFTDSTLLSALGQWNFNDDYKKFTGETREVVLYAGPKDFSEMEKVDPTTTNAISLSYFSWFESISRWFLVALNFINGFCHNYGLSIIVLTLIVKAIFWPIQTKATRSMKKMQELQPRMKEINEKYKDNPQVKQQKIMELYKTEGINPVGGCLPMLLQLPIFIALYASLNGIEMRGESFLWIHDLSKPDTVCTIFGLGIHPLIIAQTVLMIVQQKLSGAGDASQQKMMMLMPLVILFMFYDMPAGLTLYMAVSLLPQVLQELYNKYIKKSTQQA